MNKLGFTGVYIIFLISADKKKKQHKLWVLVRSSSVRRFERVPTIYVLSRNKKKISEFLSENFQFFGGEIFNIFEYACFLNALKEMNSKIPDLWVYRSINASLTFLSTNQIMLIISV